MGRFIDQFLCCQFQKSRKLETSDIEVRLQWDPDHSPSYEKLPRKAIQLGLKGKVCRIYANLDILEIVIFS